MFSRFFSQNYKRDLLEHWFWVCRLVSCRIQACAVCTMQISSARSQKAQSSSYPYSSSLFSVLPDFHILLANLQACPEALCRCKIPLCLSHHPAWSKSNFFFFFLMQGIRNTQRLWLHQGYNSRSFRAALNLMHCGRVVIGSLWETHLCWTYRVRSHTNASDWFQRRSKGVLGLHSCLCWKHFRDEIR